MRFNRKLMSLALGGLAVGAAFTYATAPVNSVSTVIIQGSASPVLRLSAGSGSGLASGTGITDGTMTVVAQDTDNFTQTINFGTLTNGSTNSVATISLRERGNTPCRVAWNCAAYTASNMTYNGTALAGSAPSELTMITFGQGAFSNGTQGQTTGASFGFANNSTFAANFPAAGGAPTSATTTKFVSLTSKPSTAGTLTGAGAADNWAQNTATITCPTGLAWAPTDGTGTGTFSATLQFDIFAGP